MAANLTNSPCVLGEQPDQGLNESVLFCFIATSAVYRSIHTATSQITGYRRQMDKLDRLCLVEMETKAERKIEKLINSTFRHANYLLCFDSLIV